MFVLVSTPFLFSKQKKSPLHTQAVTRSALTSYICTYVESDGLPSPLGLTYIEAPFTGSGGTIEMDNGMLLHKLRSEIKIILPQDPERQQR